MKGAPWWVTASYLIYTIVFDGLIFVGTGWAVFVKGHSGWWFLAAAMLGGCAYQPHKWRRLWMRAPEEATEAKAE